MLGHYATWSQDMGVIEMPEGYTPAGQIGKNLLGALLGRYWPWLLGNASLSSAPSGAPGRCCAPAWGGSARSDERIAGTRPDRLARQRG